MNYKAQAKCKNGHTMEFGQCNKEIVKFLFVKSTCKSVIHAAISSCEVQCMECRTVHLARYCPVCNDAVPVSKFI